MNKIIVILSLVFFTFTLNAQVLNRFSVGISTGIGYDMQTRSNDFDLTGPLVIPSSIGSTTLRIESPYRYNVNLAYAMNPNFKLFASVGKTERTMKYYSMDSSASATNCYDCKLGLKIKQNNVHAGAEFRTNLDSKLNFYFKPSVGMSWVKSSSRYGINHDSEQTEVLMLNDELEERLLQVYNAKNELTLSLNTAFGVEYRLNKMMSLQFDLSFENEINNNSELLMYDYNSSTKDTGGYTPYDLEFKTLYSSVGLQFDF